MARIVITDDETLAERVRAFQDRCGWPSRGLTARLVLKLIVYHLLTSPPVHAIARALHESLGNRQPLPTPTTPEELRGGQRPDVEQRLTRAQAALAQRKLRRLDDDLAHRRAVSALYDELLGKRGFGRTTTSEQADRSWVRYPVLVPDRDAAIREERRHAVLGPWFTSVLEDSEDATQAGYEPGRCSQAEWAARHLVNLPTHPRVQVKDALATAGALPGPRG